MDYHYKLLVGLKNIISILPRVLRKIEKRIVLYRFKSVGNNFSFHYPGSHFGAENIVIGDDVYIGEWANMGGAIMIGNRVMFGPRTTIAAGNHLFAILGKSPRFLEPAFIHQNDAPVIIEDEVWIGANVTILGDVRIGIGAVIGGGSVVVKDIPPFTISVGNPCRPVRRIFDDDGLFLHLTALDYSEKFSKEVISRRNDLLAGLILPNVDKTNKYSTFNNKIPNR